MVNIFKPKNLFKNMKENNQTVIITCKYHNGRNGYHDPRSSKENIVAIGRLKERCLIIESYTSLFGMKCINCPYAKFYSMNENSIREKNGKGTDIARIKLRGVPTSNKEIEEVARSLGFPYL
jgi:predicted nucleic-acid-binding Zn-ribbon protein